MKAHIALCAAALTLAGCSDRDVTVLVPYNDDLYVVSAKSNGWDGTWSGTKKLKDGKQFSVVEPGKLGVVTVEDGKVDRLGHIEYCRDGTLVSIVVWNGDKLDDFRKKYCRFAMIDVDAKK